MLLQLCLRRAASGSHGLRMSCRRPDEEHERALHAGELAVHLDVVALRALQGDPAGYGAALGEMLFADPEVQKGWAHACGLAEADRARLRVSLDIDADDPALGLWWECLRDPQGRVLSRDQHTSLSRSLAAGEGGGPVTLRRAPRVVVAVASPSNLQDYRLEPLDRPALLGWVAALQTRATCNELPRASLAGLIAALRGGCDVLFLACHGSFRGRDTVLWLEDSEGKIDRVVDDELVAAIQALRDKPRLVVLTICNGSGRGDAEDISGVLGPSLAAAGVAFVVAAQGLLTVDTAARMLPVLLAGALARGDVDAALVEARAAAQERADWWSLALFTRAPDSPLWRRSLAVPDLPRRWLAVGAAALVAVVGAAAALGGSPPAPVLVCPDTGGTVPPRLLLRVTLGDGPPVALPPACVQFSVDGAAPDMAALLLELDRHQAQTGRPFPQRELLQRDGPRALQVDAAALERPLKLQVEVGHSGLGPGPAAATRSFQYVVCPQENACQTDAVCLLSLCAPRRM